MTAASSDAATRLETSWSSQPAPPRSWITSARGEASIGQCLRMSVPARRCDERVAAGWFRGEIRTTGREPKPTDRLGAEGCRGWIPREHHELVTAQHLRRRRAQAGLRYLLRTMCGFEPLRTGPCRPPFGDGPELVGEDVGRAEVGDRPLARQGSGEATRARISAMMAGNCDERVGQADPPARAWAVGDRSARGRLRLHGDRGRDPHGRPCPAGQAPGGVAKGALQVWLGWWAPQAYVVTVALTSSSAPPLMSAQ